ncbi:hypothetical protein GUITHDRAFT_113570 [Guillardia theta CCMP2712]|uniref:SnoaL-like domain-containing protein n=1 Tax=Guillardia theta (strain CCMP2712) TaxID=905079 RepID=L1IVQ9_GUITC|nr:hypothetical protein GUITHDRAFT_113570 [Guillardia theta CCMP2712]EKX40333.1 hypothetical protein GUITHDRAFT_113570 [Guillardia theta CCMP2712]|eukprot:XP_005827313.1 hypothetical protein GUITHDRAFT_113570 [Guillardia theta CCMP2712]
MFCDEQCERMEVKTFMRIRTQLYSGKTIQEVRSSFSRVKFYLSQEKMSGTVSNNEEPEFKPFGLPKLSEFPSEANERDEHVEEVLRTVNTVFKAFADCDHALFSKFVDDECRFVRTGVAETGEPDVTAFPKAYFVNTLQKTKPGVLSEELEQPFVQMRDNLLAHVWCRYTLAVAGTVKYKGVKSIQLRNTSLGWRVRQNIVSVCDTIDS